MLAGLFGQSTATYADVETGQTSVSVYLDHLPDSSDCRFNSDVEAALQSGMERIRRCGLDVGASAIEILKVRREDWAESWKRHFHPISIGGKLLVKPSWSRKQAKQGQKVVVLDPGLSFGTGQHPTTGFCLQQLVHRRRAAEAQSLLDVGTGSGILAIAASKLGYQPVEAFDFDPEAVRVARTNARNNDVSQRIRLFQQDLTKLPVASQKKYSVICANLISNLLISAQSRLLGRLQPEGALIAAGILEKEFRDVQNACEASGMRLVASRVKGEWRSGTFVRTHT